MATQIHIAQAMSQQSKDLQEFMTAMQEHQTNLRLDINRMEVIVGCIAKSSDEEVVKYLPDAKPNHLKSARVPFHTRRALELFGLRQRSFDDGWIDLMTFADEVDSQFKQTIASFSESTAELAAYAGRFQKDCKNDRLVFSTDAPQGQH